MLMLLFSDLLNVVDSSKSLNNAVRLAFTSLYSKYSIKMVYMKYMKRRQIIIAVDDIKIFDIATCLKMMRAFGCSINKPPIGSLYEYVSEYTRNELDCYLSEYCSESVVELTYGRKTLEKLTKSFVKVEIFRFTNTRIHGSIAVGCFTEQDLRISGFDLNSTILQIVSKYSELNSLFIEDTKTELKTTDSHMAPIVFKSIKSFETHVYYFTRLDVANIVIKFEQLDKLKINGWLNVNAVSFITKHPFITTFIAKNRNSSADKQVLFHLTEVLPSVKTLIFQLFTLTPDIVAEFICKCQLLKHFEFNIKTRSEYDEIVNELGSEWKLNISDIRN